MLQDEIEKASIFLNMYIIICNYNLEMNMYSIFVYTCEINLNAFFGLHKRRVCIKIPQKQLKFFVNQNLRNFLFEKLLLLASFEFMNNNEHEY